MDSLRPLRYFVVVAEELHFGRAAERLHMAQPPLSQIIRRLEADLGVELFERTTRRVSLTSAGLSYLERARTILASVDAAGEEARRVAAGIVGHVTIGCVGSVTYSLLPALSRRLAEQLPKVEYSFRGEMLVAEQVEALRNGAIDLAVLRPPVTDGTIVVTLLREDRLVVAVPSNHHLATRKRVQVTDLEGVELVVHSAGRRSAMFDVVFRLLTEVGVAPRIRHEVGETSTLITLVAGGLGVAVVPEPVSALGLANVVYLPLVRPARRVGLAVAHRDQLTAPHVLRTVDVLREVVRG